MQPESCPEVTTVPQSWPPGLFRGVFRSHGYSMWECNLRRSKGTNLRWDLPQKTVSQCDLKCKGVPHALQRFVRYQDIHDKQVFENPTINISLRSIISNEVYSYGQSIPRLTSIPMSRGNVIRKKAQIFVHVIAYCLFGAKSLPTYVLTYYQLNSSDRNPVKYELKCKHFLAGIEKSHLQNGGQFAHASMRQWATLQCHIVSLVVSRMIADVRPHIQQHIFR